MKQFVLWAWMMHPVEQDIWRDAGFLVLPQHPGAAPEIAEPDVIWLSVAKGQSYQQTFGLENLLQQSHPKVFFLCSRDRSIMPCHWSEYQQHIIAVDGIEWLIGSKLEEALPTALADYFSQQKTADLAAVVYMTLLESVFRETAEWCGHMSSVVGRI